jgi:uncharacterized protein YbjT (DUF2867 family)
MKTALLFGASGLTGKALLEILLDDNRFSHIKVFNRRKITMAHPKLEEVIVDFDRLELVSDKIKGDVVFSCLGTTIAKAGSQMAQQKIDRDYPIAIAKIAAFNQVSQYIAVSAVGTNNETRNFYLKTKAEMEAGISQYFKEQSIFMRPSFLLGNRTEQRLGEKIGIIIAQILRPIMIGKLEKYKGIHVNDLAKAMVNAVFVKQDKNCLEYQAMIALSKTIE